MANEQNLLPPVGQGNRLAERHGFYVSKLAASEHAEIQATADAIRELVPIDSDALEPLIQGLAGKLWRRQKAYADLIANGIVRRGKPAPILRDLETLERDIRHDLEALALTPQKAADLGLTLAKTRETERGDFDPARLSIKERQQLEDLLTKAETANARP
jgi:hypothetical protein